MQPRTLQQIQDELASTYDPQINSVRQQQALIPQQMQAEEQGLQARQTQAYDDIVSGARRRGMGFSGIPLGEQAKYSATEYMPALARLRSQGKQQQMSLEDAILGINERRNTAALGIQQNDRTFAENQRQFNESLALQKQQAAAANKFNPTLGLGGSGQSLASQRKDKGFDFKDQFGNPISAAAYAAATGIPFRQVLQTMANSGDIGAKQALGFVGDDYGYDPTKINSKSLADLYNSLVWGTGRTASPYTGLSVTQVPTQRLSVR